MTGQRDPIESGIERKPARQQKIKTSDITGINKYHATLNCFLSSKDKDKTMNKLFLSFLLILLLVACQKEENDFMLKGRFEL